MSGPCENVKSPPRTEPCSPDCFAYECVAARAAQRGGAVELLQAECREKGAEITRLRAQVQWLERIAELLREQVATAERAARDEAEARGAATARVALLQERVRELAGLLRETLTRACIRRGTAAVDKGWISDLDRRCLETVEAFEAEEGP